MSKPTTRRKEYAVYDLKGELLCTGSMGMLAVRIGGEMHMENLYICARHGKSLRGHHISDKLYSRVKPMRFGFGELSTVYKYSNEILVKTYGSMHEACWDNRVRLSDMRSHMYYNQPLDCGLVFKPYKKTLLEWNTKDKFLYTGEIYSLEGELLYLFEDRQDLGGKLNASAQRIKHGVNDFMCNNTVEIIFNEA